MKAMICDLCGDFFSHPKKLPKYKLAQISETSSRYTKSMDICPKCQDDLAKWIEEKRKENKF